MFLCDGLDIRSFGPKNVTMMLLLNHTVNSHLGILRGREGEGLIII